MLFWVKNDWRKSLLAAIALSGAALLWQWALGLRLDASVPGWASSGRWRP
ncbi:MAG: hypothetical protein HY717_13600 [Planctomycetes bacterium]|nr:hypothetical protein [Planctomycetota bacterium]